MKFSEAWLREWVSPAISTAELTHQLTMAGLEVESVAPVAGVFSGVVVGAVLARDAHPDADKLSLCTVDVGGDTALQIVCGAKNVAAGQRVPVAMLGAVLPGEFRIEPRKVRGVASQGMICSAKELGLADASEGIMVLPVDAPVGTPFRDYLALDDQAIEIKLTPDRGDCLGLAGVARELGVINRLDVNVPDTTPVAQVLEDRWSVALEAPAACPRYTCRVIRNCRRDAETPLWMRERLRRADLRPINPAVDVTNYVLLELGQPMHGFDLARIDGGIRVRLAQPGERLQLLDGSEIELRPDTLVIADQARPLAMAGIMGGESSGVTAETTDILLESAFFAPSAITGKGRAYGIQTDSSYRFERGVDPGLQVAALERATRLILAIAGGEPGPVVEAVAAEHLPQRPEIHLRRRRLAQMLGLELPDAEVTDILRRLGMGVVELEDGWRVQGPTWRFDIAIEADLIEEVGRIHGYDRIPMHRCSAAAELSLEPEGAFSLDRAKQVLVERDYQEAITYSFISRELHDLMDPAHGTVELANPISAEMGVMRTSLWPGLIQTALHNLARQQERIRIFETGLRFIQEAGGILQQRMLAGLVTGDEAPEQWGQVSRPADFYDLKGDLEAVLALTGRVGGFSFEPEAHPALHPGQSARVVFDGRPVGWIGMLHPEVERRLDFPRRVFLFEIQVDALPEARLPAFRPLSRFPSIRRDIAVLVDTATPFEIVLECARRAAPEIVQDIRLFDVYNGENIDSGRKSLALSLIIQGTENTLTDQEGEAAVAAVVQALGVELNARLRD